VVLRGRDPDALDRATCEVAGLIERLASEGSEAGGVKS
jgi:hypothetical protein